MTTVTRLALSFDMRDGHHRAEAVASHRPCLISSAGFPALWLGDGPPRRRMNGYWWPQPSQAGSSSHRPTIEPNTRQFGLLA